MKLGFSTGNRKGPGVSKTAPADRFIQFHWESNGKMKFIQFFNQKSPPMAAAMLRQMADAIEREAGV